MGSSNPLKEWALNHWIELIHQFEASGQRVYLTGKGAREQQLCSSAASMTKAKNLCDQLEWSGFISTIQEARLVITVDSAAVHIAAGALTPTVVLYAGINSPHMWVPPSPFCKWMMHRVGCAPCLNKAGCPTMACIQGIRPEQVYQLAMDLEKGRVYQ